MKFLKYCFMNMEPLRIADDSTSQSGQTMCCRYIPGTTMRGFIINKLACSDHAEFEDYKSILFSNQVSFMNAYPRYGEQELIPSPKGFYESKKADGKIQNVVISGLFDEGMKRAGLGRYARFDKDTIHYYSVETGSDLKIKMNADDQNVFRNEYIMAGHVFAGAVAFDNEVDSHVIEKVKNCLEGQTIILGNGRSQGLGKCQVMSVAIEKEAPYQSLTTTEDAKDSVYMLLTSNLVMRNSAGEYCGINTQELQEKLGVSNLTIEHCATSTVTVRGYNSIWGTAVPSVVMYEMGSCFKLHYEGVASVERMEKLSEDGLGVKLNEGCGRVLFLGSQYENLTKKEQGQSLVQSKITENLPLTEEDKEVLKIAARSIYMKRIFNAERQGIIEHKLALSIPRSQMGKVQSLLEANRYSSDIEKSLNAYFEHAIQKEEARNKQKEKASIKPFKTTIMKLLQTPLTETLNIDATSAILGYRPSELIDDYEMKRLQVDFILELIRFYNKEGK